MGLDSTQHAVVLTAHSEFEASVNKANIKNKDLGMDDLFEECFMQTVHSTMEITISCGC